MLLPLCLGILHAVEPDPRNGKKDKTCLDLSSIHREAGCETVKLVSICQEPITLCECPKGALK